MELTPRKPLAPSDPSTSLATHCVLVVVADAVNDEEALQMAQSRFAELPKLTLRVSSEELRDFLATKGERCCQTDEAIVDEDNLLMCSQSEIPSDELEPGLPAVSAAVAAPTPAKKRPRPRHIDSEEEEDPSESLNRNILWTKKRAVKEETEMVTKNDHNASPDIVDMKERSQEVENKMEQPPLDVSADSSGTKENSQVAPSSYPLEVKRELVFDPVFQIVVEVQRSLAARAGECAALLERLLSLGEALPAPSLNSSSVKQEFASFDDFKKLACLQRGVVEGAAHCVDLLNTISGRSQEVKHKCREGCWVEVNTSLIIDHIIRVHLDPASYDNLMTKAKHCFPGFVPSNRSSYQSDSQEMNCE